MTDKPNFSIFEFVVLLIGVIAVFQAKFLVPLENLKSDIMHLIYFFQENLAILMVFLGLVVLLFFTYLNFKLNCFVKEKIEERKQRKITEKEVISKIESLLANDKKVQTSFEAKDCINLASELLSKSNKKIKNLYETRLKEYLLNSNFKLKELVHKENLHELHEREDSILERIRKLESDEMERLRKEEEAEDAKLNFLDVKNHPVFVKSDLSKKEIDLLIRNDYSHLNEYCVDQQKNISVLVKPTLNHSKTHTFLVWSTMKLLQNMKDVSYVHDWDTKEADITFRHEGQTYAIEVETGTLLSKKHQLREKFDYLNSKYKDRWLVLVSNKNLVSKYNKFGLTSQRSELREKLKKLMKSATQ